MSEYTSVIIAFIGFVLGGGAVRVLASRTSEADAARAAEAKRDAELQNAQLKADADAVRTAEAMARREAEEARRAADDARR